MWPSPLIDELAARRCIIFLGAGASAGCVNSETPPKRPPTWGKLLAELIALTQARAPDAAKIATELIQKERFLDAAEILTEKINSAEFTALIRKTFVEPRYLASDMHKSVLSIDPKIVVTTNFDDIYDNYCKSGAGTELYNICRYYEDHIVSDLRSPIRLIIKAHGCVGDPSRVVLSRSDYFRERQMHSNFYQVLDALFLTHTVLFIGYSISDPDIQLLLENSTIAYKATHPHYALVEDSIPPALENAYKRAYNIDFIKFPIGQYDDASAKVRELAEAVTQKRTRNPV